MAEFSSIVREPLALVQELFKSAGCPTGSEADFGVQQRLKELLADPAALAQVPLLTHENVDYLPNNSLVRFRGMVQDMGNPEYYYGAVKLRDGSWVTTKYGDAMNGVDIDAASDTKVWERRPVYCVPIPGQSAWCSEPAAKGAQATGDAAGRAKRGREEQGTDGEGQGPESMDVEAPTDQQQQQAAAPEAGGQQAAKQAKQGQEAGAAAAKPAGAAAAAADAGSMPGDCLVYVYDQPDSVLLHDVVEVVGVVSKMPELAACHMEAEAHGHGQGCGAHKDKPTTAREAFLEDSMAEQLAAHPPTSQVMRLHAVLVVRQPPLAPTPQAASLDLASAPAVAQARAAALELLTLALGGDALAAEYLLLACLARVASRSAGQAGMGIPALNLTRCPEPVPAVPLAAAGAAGAPAAGSAQAKAQALAQAQAHGTRFGRALLAAFGELLPAASYLPLSVTACNTGPSWAPRRDYETNRLSRSPLQLARGSVLVVDETVMGEGRLSEAGIASFQALYSMLQDQALTYDFQFYTSPVPVSVAPVVLSVGRSVMKDALPLTLPLNTTRPLPDVEGVRAAAAAAGPAVMGAVRAYLGAVAELPYAIDDAMSESLQSEFVSQRKADREFSPDTFHARLTVAKLAALSFGEARLSPERWAYAKDLEARRSARARVM